MPRSTHDSLATVLPDSVVPQLQRLESGGQIAYCYSTSTILQLIEQHCGDICLEHLRTANDRVEFVRFSQCSKGSLQSPCMLAQITEDIGEEADGWKNTYLFTCYQDVWEAATLALTCRNGDRNFELSVTSNDHNDGEEDCTKTRLKCMLPDPSLLTAVGITALVQSELQNADKHSIEVENFHDDLLEVLSIADEETNGDLLPKYKSDQSCQLLQRAETVLKGVLAKLLVQPTDLGLSG